MEVIEHVAIKPFTPLTPETFTTKVGYVFDNKVWCSSALKLIMSEQHGVDTVITFHVCAFGHVISSLA